MAELVPRPPLEFLRYRLRLVVVEAAFMPDQDLLELISDGYQRACERGRLLPRVTTIPYAGVAELAVPADFYAVLYAADEDGMLERIDETAAARGERGWIMRGGVLVQPQLHDSGALTLLYAATPSRFLTWTDVPVPEFPPEAYYLLAHYVRWRVYEMSRGAAGISWSLWERSQFEGGVAELASRAGVADLAAPMRVAIPNAG